MTTAEVRIKIGLKFAGEVSDHGVIEILQRIKFNSQFGLIDVLAFADYQHEFKKELLCIQAGGNLRVNPINSLQRVRQVRLHHSSFETFWQLVP
jgi:hypothetical protein